jgi:DNA polymerase-4
MSRETTFDRDLHAVRDRAEAGAVLTRLCEQVAGDLQRKGYTGRTIGIKITFDNFEKVTRDITIEQATADATVIRRHAGLCLKRVDLSRRFRLLGVRVGKLVKPGTEGAEAPPYSGATPSHRQPKADDERTDLLFPELD